RRDGAGVRLLTRRGHNLLLTSVAALLMVTSAAHARPELSKTQSWKLILGTWCVGDHPSDNGAYVGIRRDKCGENELTLIIRENEYRWEREEGLSCRYLSGRARVDNTIPTSTKIGVWVFHIEAKREFSNRPFCGRLRPGPCRSGTPRSIHGDLRLPGNKSVMTRHCR